MIRAWIWVQGRLFLWKKFGKIWYTINCMIYYNYQRENLLKLQGRKDGKDGRNECHSDSK